MCCTLGTSERLRKSIIAFKVTTTRDGTRGSEYLPGGRSAQNTKSPDLGTFFEYPDRTWIRDYDGYGIYLYRDRPNRIHSPHYTGSINHSQQVIEVLVPEHEIIQWGGDMSGRVILLAKQIYVIGETKTGAQLAHD